MEPATPMPSSVVTTNVTVTGKDYSLSFQATVPAGPTSVGQLLPLAQSLSDVVVDQTCSSLEASGSRISCTSGCGACCRGFVAITQAEARQIRDLVHRLPEPRRQAVLDRFAQALRKLTAEGLLGHIQEAESWTSADYKAMVTRYFGLGIPCPFLDNESCSIYAERPITCREFLVTSPARHCSELDSAEVRRVALPIHMFHAVARWQTPSFNKGDLEPWVPLNLSLEWAESNPDGPPTKTGLELLKDLLDRIKEYA